MNKEIEGIVEIGSKPIVERRATATGLLNLCQDSAEAISDQDRQRKENVLEAFDHCCNSSGQRHASNRSALSPDTS